MGEEEHFELRHIWETLLDWQVWAHILIYMSIIAPRESLPSALCALRGYIDMAQFAQRTASHCSFRE